MTRSSGILLHISSLPSRFGIGDLGLEAYNFVHFLHSANQKLWQVLPLSPTGYGNSPYSSYSAFAGNHFFISPEILLEQGFLSDQDFTADTNFPEKIVDFEKALPEKFDLLQKAFQMFVHRGVNEDFLTFREKNVSWLGNYSLFMALKMHFDGKSWDKWKNDIKLRLPEAVSYYAKNLSAEITFHEFAQWQFFRQWQSLKQYANSVGVSIVGDMPIFLAYDSADVWANQHLFRLNKDGSPKVVSGVPPDYFSATGQRWGNPHYNWQAMRSDGFAWWIQRFSAMFAMYDIVRIDHFRGFESAWEINARAETAAKGKWGKTPGKELFTAIQQHFPALPVIAEDLGLITEKVTELRQHFGFPGMKVMQFGFESNDARNDFLPHNFEKNCVVYTGTHDNDTTLGWLNSARTEVKKFTLDYLEADDAKHAVRHAVRSAMASTAKLAIIPVQDILELDSAERMNIPGAKHGNWAFRLEKNVLTTETATRLANWSHLFGR